MNERNSSDWKEQLKRSWRVPLLERVNEQVRAFSPGDRAIFYVLAFLIGATSLLGLYALEQSLLREVPAYGGGVGGGGGGGPRGVKGGFLKK